MSEDLYDLDSYWELRVLPPRPPEPEIEAAPEPIQELTFTPRGVYLGLFTALPQDTNEGVELTDTRYARASVNPRFTSNSRGESVAEITHRFPPMSTPVVVMGGGLWDAPVGGNLLYFSSLAVNLRVDLGMNAEIHLTVSAD